MLLPLGFLVALLQARGFAARALQTLVQRLAARPSPRALARRSWPRPSTTRGLRLGYHDPASGEFREAGGGELIRTPRGRRAACGCRSSTTGSPSRRW